LPLDSFCNPLQVGRFDASAWSKTTPQSFVLLDRLRHSVNHHLVEEADSRQFIRSPSDLIANSKCLLGNLDLCEDNPVWTVRIKLKRKSSSVQINDLFALSINVLIAIQHACNFPLCTRLNVTILKSCGSQFLVW